jgi:hypothetical protein
MTPDEEFVRDTLVELKRAREKFPSPAGSMTALTEEVGELAKALLDEPPERIRAEAIQVAVMAIRVATEGDPTLDAYRQQRAQEKAGKATAKATPTEARADNQGKTGARHG